MTARDVPDELGAHLGRARWFAGKNAGVAVGELRRLATLPGRPATEVCVLDVVENGTPARYQIDLSVHDHPVERLASSYLGRLGEGDGFAYDALFDRDTTRAWLDLLADGSSVGQVDFHRLGAGAPPVEREGLVLSAEQSHTSLVFGEQVILKVYRRLSDGVNPEVEVAAALSRVGCGVIAEPYGYAQSPEGTLAYVSQFLAGGVDGFALATGSVRDLFVEADLHAEEVGGDFAAEAERLGGVTATLHADLRAAFPDAVGQLAAPQRAAAMRAGLASAVSAVPELADLRERVTSVYDEMAALGRPVTVQRVHGDLHLGQAMRTMGGWRLLDFEGEPSRPPDQRRQPDVVERDVAGLLRSLDYAAHLMVVDHPGDAQLSYRAGEWVTRNRAALCRGYQAAAGWDPRASEALLRALEVEKAVYEVVYESQMRPAWVGVPLAALDRLT